MLGERWNLSSFYLTLTRLAERWRYDFLHGTQVIRHFRGQTVLPAREHTLLYKALLPVLLYAPLAHLYDYEAVYLDGVLAYEPEWTRHMKKLLAEWQEFTLYVRTHSPTSFSARQRALMTLPCAGNDLVERQPRVPFGAEHYPVPGWR